MHNPNSIGYLDRPVVSELCSVLQPLSARAPVSRFGTSRLGYNIC